MSPATREIPRWSCGPALRFPENEHAPAAWRDRDRPPSRRFPRAVSQSPVCTSSRTVAVIRPARRDHRVTPISRAASAIKFGARHSCKSGLKPARFQHERRAHHHSAAAVEPFRLRARFWKTGCIHQRDLPFELHPFRVALLQLSPHRYRPKTPGGDRFEIVRDRDADLSFWHWTLDVERWTLSASASRL